MTLLTISHFIYLKPEEVTKLSNRQQVEIIGWNVPVWFYKGSTSEPAEEVFCKYIITNLNEEHIVELTRDGYKLNIPQEETKSKKIEELTFKIYKEDESEEKNIKIVHNFQIRKYELLLESMS